MGTPAIELMDFSGLTETHLPFRDDHGHPKSIYQHLGLVLGAKNFEEPEGQVDRIVNDRPAVTAELGAAYDSVYYRMDDPISRIVSDLERILVG